MKIMNDALDMEFRYTDVCIFFFHMKKEHIVFWNTRIDHLKIFKSHSVITETLIIICWYTNLTDFLLDIVTAAVNQYANTIFLNLCYEMNRFIIQWRKPNKKKNQHHYINVLVLESVDIMRTRVVNHRRFTKHSLTSTSDLLWCNM